MKKSLKSFLTLVKDQVLGGSTKSSQASLKFTDKCRSRMVEQSLSEDMVSYVFHSGEEKKPQMLVKSFNGFEIGLYYFRDRKSLDYVITSVWKRYRR
jgi:hypothetical protein